MMQMFRRKMKNQKGFTLIELIVVIAILGILAAIAVPRFSGFTDKAKNVADEQLVNLINNSLVLLEAEGKETIPSDLVLTADKTGKKSLINFLITKGLLEDSSKAKFNTVSNWKLENNRVVPAP